MLADPAAGTLRTSHSRTQVMSGIGGKLSFCMEFTFTEGQVIFISFY
jgi:acyl-CoA hydrolase